MSVFAKPKGFEMRSGPGKHLDEKFNSHRLQEVASRKFVPSLQLPNILSKLQRKLSPQALDRLIEEAKNREGAGRKTERRERNQASAAFAVQGRNEYYQATARRDRVPSLGYYTPLFTGIYSTPSVHILKPSRSARSVGKTARASEMRELPDTLGQSSHVLAFQRQLPRPDPTTMTKDVSEKRFEAVPEPLISSKCKKVVTPNISKFLERRPISTPRTSPRYSPKFDVVWRKSSPALDFAKVTSRRQDASPPGLQLCYENIRFSQTLQKAPQWNFAKVAARPVTEEFPAHMVNVSSRLGLTVQQEVVCVHRKSGM